MKRILVKKQPRVWIAIAAIIIAMLISISAAAFNYSSRVNEDLANNLIRLHVIANSNSEKDQSDKLAVRDALLKRYYNQLSAFEGSDEAEEFLTSNLAQINQLAEETLRERGVDYRVTSSVELCGFPTKEYGNIALPSGDYRALRIIIGEGKGENWWCVMFPPLCIVDGSTGELSDDAMRQLKASLSKEEYQLITEGKNGKPSVQMRFKVVEFFQNGKGQLATLFR